jgi:hypothetical protein
MTFAIGQKLVVVKQHRESHVLKAKLNSVGHVTSLPTSHLYIKGIPTPTKMAVIELANGTTMEAPLDCFEEYRKVTKKTLKTMTNEELLEKYTSLVLEETQAKSIITKSYQKIVENVARHESELLYRLNSK